MKKNTLRNIGLCTALALFCTMEIGRGWNEVSHSVTKSNETVVKSLSMVGTSYRNTFRSTSNGSFTTLPVLPKAAEMVTITLVPDEGYEVSTVTVTNSSGLQVVLVNLGDNRYQFQQPDSTVILHASFSAIVPPVKIENFQDLKPTDWHYGFIDMMIRRGVMYGVSDTIFDPSSNVTRGQMAVIISSIQNKGDLVYIKQELTDMKEDSWYYDAAQWCVYNGILIADTWTEFEGDRNITREELLQALFYFGKHAGMYTHVYNRDNIYQYDDWQDISDDCIDPVSWGLRNFFIRGDTDGNLNPQGEATRAEVAVILSEFFTGYDYFVTHNTLKN